MTDAALETANRVKALAPGAAPRIGVILGSGLGAVADQVEKPVHIRYADLPSFPQSSVAGHAGKMVLGGLGGASVVVMQGRVHLYEGMRHDDIKVFVRTLKRLGCDAVLITNAAGSLRREMGPGSLMAVTDHISFIPGNPLIGPNDDAYGPRFPALEDAYDPALRALLQRAAKRLNVNLAEGVYAGCLGPSFETPAEIRAYAKLGADAVGMSTVPETIVARHCGLRVAAVSVITNLAAGMSDEKLSHEQTLNTAGRAAETLSKLVMGFLEEYARSA